MPLTACTAYSDKALIAIYAELVNCSSNPVWKIKSDAINEIIHLINDAFKEIQIWALTSHDRLVLLTENNWETKCYVIIRNIRGSEYYFEYLIPETKRPWPDALIHGVAPSLK
jgi:hypothetical protein